MLKVCCLWMQASAVAYAERFDQAQVEHELEVLCLHGEMTSLDASLTTSNTELDRWRAQSTQDAAALQQLQAELVSARQQLGQAAHIARRRGEVCKVPDPQSFRRSCH
jgi:capsule polysaccharide export protein KpsE/RkpR